jgi:MFS family permease
MTRSGYGYNSKSMQQTIESATDDLQGITGITQEPLDVPGRRNEARHHLTQLQLVVRYASLATTFLVLAIPIYTSNFGASGLEKGLLFAIPAFMMAIARPIIGKGIDRFGRKLFLVVGVAIMFLSMLLFAASREIDTTILGIPIQTDKDFAIGMLVVARTVQGFALGTMLLSSYTITADLARQAGRASSFGSTEEAQYRGGLVGAVIAVPVLLAFGFNPSGVLQITDTAWSILFSIYAIGVFVALAYSFRNIPETRGLALKQAEHEPHRKIDRQLYVLMAIVALTSASSYGLAPFILTFIRDHLTDNLIFIAMAYVPAALIWAFLPSRLGVVADRVGRKPPMVAGLTMSGLFSLTIPFLTLLFPDHALAIVALSLFATVEAACYAAAVPAEQALVADMTGGKQRGMGFGLYTLAQSLGHVIGPLVMGALYDVDRSGPFIANAVILIIGSFLVWFVLKDPAKAHKPG